jgi:hypothetical protein
MASTAAMLAGLSLIPFGAPKLGRYLTPIAHTVISGFMSGIGFILIIVRLPGSLGAAAAAAGPATDCPRRDATRLPGLFGGPGPQLRERLPRLGMDASVPS